MKRPGLMIASGELSGQRFDVKEGGLRLGRSSSNDIHLPDEELSRNHCLFEAVGEEGLRLTDLASANGTYLNGKALGGDPADLKVGDTIEVGKTVIRVVGESTTEPVAGSVDLGLGDGQRADSNASRRRTPLSLALWLLAVAAVGAAIYVVLMTPTGGEEPVAVTAEEDVPTLCEAFYEKVQADSNGIFRYELTLSVDGVLSVAVDDEPGASRLPSRSKKLSEQSLTELGDILAWKTLREIDREYAGAEPDPPALNSWTLSVVYSTRARSVRVVNTQEPEAFRAVRERLEAFSQNELGINAIQYSREKLIALAEEAIALGRSKWEERNVQHGNLFAAVTAYREAGFYLETVNPKPPCGQDALRGLEESQNELDRRYRDQRFLVDRAISLGQWETAQRELQVLLEMIPDRKDDRNREATTKLIDVEKRVKGGK